jgi:hypothetical protein
LQGICFPVLKENNPVSLEGAPAEVQDKISRWQKLVMLKRFQQQNNKLSPGYVLCKGDCATNRSLILQYFNPANPTIKSWRVPVG